MRSSIELENLPAVDDIAGVVEDVFGVKLAISGGWGYDNTTALVIHNIEVPLEQFFHMFGSMRANVQMNLTLEEQERFGAINLTFVSHKELKVLSEMYDIVTFKITAINEKIYNNFIQEYKENYGKKEFNLEDHFKRRQENTIELLEDFWFLQKIEKNS